MTRFPAPIVLDGESLTVMDVVHAARDNRPVELDAGIWRAVSEGRKRVEEVLAAGGRAYGVTTGVGSQKLSPLSAAEVPSFNQRLVVAHATTASRRLLSPTVVRAALLVQLNGFASGRCGVSEDLLVALYERYRAGACPPASSGASVGASDLVPLAQMALPLLGISSPLGPDAVEPGEPFRLSAKEGLSLINSNAVSLGQGALSLLQARKLLRGFDLSACLSLEGFRGNLNILHDAVLDAHPQPGQHTATGHMRRLMERSALHEPGAARFLQDPLSFRCVPQVHGAAYSALEWVWKNWEIELNTVQDNPCVDVSSGQLISHGNMDGTLLSLGMDNLRSAFGAVLSISAQRLHKLHWPSFSGLPTGLNETQSALGGVQFLNLSHIAEAYGAAARVLARPSLLSYQGQLADGVEDHATLLPSSIQDTEQFIDLAWGVQALEVTTACWAIRRRQLPLDHLGLGLREAFEAVDRLLPIGREGHEVFDVRPVVDLIRDGEIVDLIDESAPPLPEFEPPVAVQAGGGRV